MRGRPPKPIEKHIKEGTLTTRQKAKTPTIIGGRKKPTCPTHLKGSARAAYRLIINDLWDAGILDKADRTLIATAAMHYGAAIEAQEKVDKYGLMYQVTRGARDGSKGYKVIEPNPAVKILRDSLGEFRQCCDLLGIGPSARARLAHLGVKGKSPTQEIAGLSTAARLRAVPDE